MKKYIILLLCCLPATIFAEVSKKEYLLQSIGDAYGTKNEVEFLAECEQIRGDLNSEFTFFDFLFAIRDNKVPLVQCLLAAGFKANDYNIEWDSFDSPLVYAHGNSAMTELLLDAGAGPLVVPTALLKQLHA